MPSARKRTSTFRRPLRPWTRRLTEMETLGLPIHITELDVNSAAAASAARAPTSQQRSRPRRAASWSDADKRQADAYAGIFRAFLKHRDSVKIVTFWGVNDAVSWRKRSSAVVRRAKPAQARL